MAKTTKAIVIGAGVGGLAAAAYLGKLGLDVLALEQAEEPGGLLRPHKFGDYQFNWAVHYVGMCRPGQMLHRALSELDLDASELFCEFEPDGFDIFRFPDVEIRMGNNLDDFHDRLTTHFPRQGRGLDRYFDLLKAMQVVVTGLDQMHERGFRWTDLRLINAARGLLRWIRRPYADLLNELFDDPRLQAVLSAPWGNWAIPASRVGALYPLAGFNYYADGAFFPRGGSGALRDALVTRAKSNGVEIRCCSPVSRIHVKDHLASGVELSNGEHIDCDLVVSDVDPVLTYGNMIDQESLPQRMREKVAKTRPSLSVFWVFLGLNRDLRAHGMSAANIWDHPSWDLEASFKSTMVDRNFTDGMLFISPNSLKDDSHTIAPQGKSTIELIIAMPYEIFAKWEGIPAASRGPEYEKLTAKIGNALISEFDKRFPGILGDVEVMEFASPVDINLRTKARHGGIYGPALSPEQTPPRRFSHRSPIRNLFLVGAGVYGGSINGCILSAKHAAKISRELL
jgi:phytoene dehydrogenase-like protein